MTEVPLTIDNLIESNGNWMVAYVYCNWGKDHVLMLLSRIDPNPDSLETEINIDVMNLPDGTFEESYMIDEWNKQHPGSPFLIRKEGGIATMVTEMNAQLQAYGWDRFLEEQKEFDQWCKVAHYVTQHEGTEYEVWHTGWKSMIERAENFVKERNKDERKEIY